MAELNSSTMVGLNRLPCTTSTHQQAWMCRDQHVMSNHIQVVCYSLCISPFHNSQLHLLPRQLHLLVACCLLAMAFEYSQHLITRLLAIMAIDTPNSWIAAQMEQAGSAPTAG